ncbi:Stk1 family PASTA domain-containing Ser/Thr kinase [Fodinicola acaciae]|uniref:Stk1 family PASTA domain-containing Ser/Thr kinase n=1 Tax=Fodinicola acaciae TaxID=2681555 RepID=UPI0013D448EC|nr:Stk1 family PASTA domain-containing Ser/Thr kinase [Fodinicola acaciae]
MTEARLLGGRYQLGEILGYGGMAEVHRGTDLRLGRDVAVKVLRADLARDQGFQTRFRREAQNAAALNHPAIVAVYDTGEETNADGVALPYIVMEYVEGRTLKEVLADEGRLQPERAMEITADVCSALDFSHRNGIVHRDIKPANVMLTTTGSVKVMDFGIARAVAGGTSTMTQTSAVIGTAQYLSPEQARGETVDARSDVYSTGCLLYELLIGHPPFTGDSPVAVAYQHVRENPIPPSQLNPDVTPDVDAIVLKAMAKNPANRYQSGAEMRSDLLRAAAGRPVSATPVMSDDERTQLINTPPLQQQHHRRVEPEEEDRRRRGLIITGVVIAIIVVFAIAAFATTFLLNNSKSTTPNVQNQPVAAAQQQMQSAGFQKCQEKPAPNDSIASGNVIGQDPPAGAAASKGASCTLTVSSGPASQAVPDFTDKKFADAKAWADPLGINVTQQTDSSSSKPAGAIVKQDPAPGTKMKKGDTLTITVSGGQVQVPGVVGASVDSARSQITGAGFKFHISSYKDTTDQTLDNTVASQDPGDGAKAASGSTVNVVVYRYKPKASPSTSPTDGGITIGGPGGTQSPTTGQTGTTKNTAGA